MFTLLADSHTEVSIFCNSGSNVHMTPLEKDLRNTDTVNRSCTLGDKGQLHAAAVGDMPT